MSQTEKAAYFQALKDSGIKFDKHYREYRTDELKLAYDQLAAQDAAAPLAAPGNGTEPDAEAAAFFGYAAPEPPEPAPVAPLVERDPEEMAGVRLNVKDEDEPIRTDEEGRVWLQEEVKKPAYPKPRGRRVLKYMDPGVEKKTVKSGDYTEEFEISGDPANAVPAEIKITLPSYQVGIYKDPRFPFKVICYNGNDGFDLEEVRTFYGGGELVPADVKLKYVENVLCYDMRTVIRAIETEYRQTVLGMKA